MKRVLLLGLVILGTIGLAAPVFCGTRIANGVVVSDDGTPAPAPTASGETTEVSPLGGGGSGAGFTGFDDMTPCGFSQAFPLQKSWFKSYGVQFKGPNSTDGGALLDECSAFGVTGHSAPNFLAFNCESQLANGGVPFGVETILFAPPVDAAQISIGSGGSVGQTVNVVAKTADGGTVDSASVTLTSAMQSVFLIGSKKIKKVIVSVPSGSSACYYVIDNVYYGTP